MQFLTKRFRGRTGRIPFLVPFLCIIIFPNAMILRSALVLIPADLILISDDFFFYITLSTILISYLLSFLLILIPITVRRLHDINRSGWFSILILIPVIHIFLTLYLVIARGNTKENRYGAPQDVEKEKLKFIFLLILSSVLLIYVIKNPLLNLDIKISNYPLPKLNPYSFDGKDIFSE